MPVNLWHFTWPENVDSILANGFRNGEQGYVFFAPPHDAYWELSGKVLLEVTLDVEEEHIAVTKSESEYPNNYIQIVYHIPAEFVNLHQTTICVVTADDYLRHHIPPQFIANPEPPAPL